jgi:hypothetical protein
VESFAGLDGLDDLLRTSDIVSLHVPLTGETTHLIDERRLRLLKPTSRLVNVARGRIVDEDALVRVIRERAIAGAGIDVFGQACQPTIRSCISTASWRRLTHGRRDRGTSRAAAGLHRTRFASYGGSRSTCDGSGLSLSAAERIPVSSKRRTSSPSTGLQRARRSSSSTSTST